MNNPLNYADPTGHRAMSPVAGGFKAVGKAIKTVSNAVKNITATVSQGAAIVANSARQIGNTVRGTGGGTVEYASSVTSIAKTIEKIRYNHIKEFCTVFRPRLSPKINNPLQRLNLTISKGVNLSATLGVFTYDLSFGISFDTKGNLGVQYSFAGGVTASSSPSIALMKYETYTNAPDIYTLEADGANIGGSGGGIVYGVPLYASGDMVLVGDVNGNSDNLYYGVNTAIGIGTPGAEGHAEISYTGTLWSVNMHDLLNNKK